MRGGLPKSPLDAHSGGVRIPALRDGAASPLVLLDYFENTSLSSPPLRGVLTGTTLAGAVVDRPCSAPQSWRVLHSYCSPPYIPAAASIREDKTEGGGQGRVARRRSTYADPLYVVCKASGRIEATTKALYNCERLLCLSRLKRPKA